MQRILNVVKCLQDVCTTKQGSSMRWHNKYESHKQAVDQVQLDD
jgi:hypothetical protein